METPDCFDHDTVAALAEGALDDPARVGLMPHLATCARCRHAVASVARALDDSIVAREVAGATGVGRRRLFQLAIPVAAAALLLLVFAWPRDGGPGDGHRGPPPIAPAPVPIAPIGVVADAGTLEWTAVPGADRYRLTLSDSSGRVLYEMQVTDTVAALPDSIVLVPGRSYVWLVEARSGIDRWTTSRLVDFSIAKAPPR